VSPSDPPAPPPAAPSPMTARSAPTGTVSSSWARISCSVPATGDGISVSTLSVDTSRSGSSTSTVSPTFFSQRVTVPSVTDSPRAGMVTRSDMSWDSSDGYGLTFGRGPILAECSASWEVQGQAWACSGLPASARWASPRASF
jgi:hypothetical protein